MTSAGARLDVDDRGPRRPRATVAAWALLVVLGAVVLWGPLSYDFRENPVRGDQASHLLQALSLAYDNHTLNFSQANFERWREVGWDPVPYGLFFQRYEDGRAAFAKPYGYSVYLAPFVAVAGAVRGVAIANTLLVVLLCAISIALLRRRFKGPAVPLVVAAMFLASYAYMYAYVIHTELFLALMTLCALGAVLMYRDTRRPAWGLVAMAIMGFGISEKAAFAVLFLPLIAVMVWEERRRWLKLALPATLAAAFVVAVLPYLYYSDWKSFTPYGGDRFYAESSVPFAPPEFANPAGYVPLNLDAAEVASAAGPVEDKLLAVGYTFAGRHTGMLVFVPVALFLLLGAVAGIRKWDRWAVAALAGVLGYIVFYAVFFPLNFYGGGQSLGDRYFLQIAPAVVVLALLARLSSRWALASGIAGLALAVVMLWPHHIDADHAYIELDRTSALQRVLPFESNQQYAPYFECGATTC